MELFQRPDLQANEDGGGQRHGFPAYHGCQGGKARPGRTGEEGDFRHAHSGGGNQPRGGGTQAIEHAVHKLALPELLQKLCDYQNDDYGRRNQPQRGRHAAQHLSHGNPGAAPHGEAHIGGHIHPHGPGSGLGDGDHVRQVPRAEPPGGFPHVLEKGDSGKAPAHREEADLKKLVKKPQENHAFHPLAARTESPHTPATTTRNTGDTRKEAAGAAAEIGPEQIDSSRIMRNSITVGRSFTVVFISFSTLERMRAATQARTPAKA